MGHTEWPTARGLHSAGVPAPPRLPISVIDVASLPISDVATQVLERYKSEFGPQPRGQSWNRPDDWRRLSFVLDLLDRGDSVLDVGLGAGQFVNMLAASGRFKTVHGIDRIRYKQYAEFYPNIETQIGSVAELPFEDGQFDVVTCMEVLEHVPDDVFIAGLAELRRVCRGQLIMSVPYCEPEPISKHHVRRFEDDDIIRIFPDGAYALLRRPKMPWILIEERPRRVGRVDRDQLLQLQTRVAELESELRRLRARRSLRAANWLGGQRRRLAARVQAEGRRRRT